MVVGEHTHWIELSGATLWSGRTYGASFYPDGRLFVGDLEGPIQLVPESNLWGPGQGVDSPLNLPDLVSHPIGSGYEWLDRESRWSISPSGRGVDVTGDGRVRHWSPTEEGTGRPKDAGQLPAECTALDVEWHPSLDLIGVGCSDGAVLLWDLENARLVATLRSWPNGGGWVAYTPSGHFDGDRAGLDGLMLRIDDSTFRARDLPNLRRSPLLPYLDGSSVDRREPTD